MKIKNKGNKSYLNFFKQKFVLSFRNNRRKLLYKDGPEPQIQSPSQLIVKKFGSMFRFWIFLQSQGWFGCFRHISLILCNFILQILSASVVFFMPHLQNTLQRWVWVFPFIYRYRKCLLWNEEVGAVTWASVGLASCPVISPWPLIMF